MCVSCAVSWPRPDTRYHPRPTGPGTHWSVGTGAGEPVGRRVRFPGQGEAVTGNGYLQGRAAIGWHVVYGVIAATTLAVMVLGNRVGSPGWLVRIGLLGALCGWYATMGRPALHGTTLHSGLWYLAGAAVLTFALFAVAPVGALMLFPLYPHIWALDRKST